MRSRWIRTPLVALAVTAAVLAGAGVSTAGVQHPAVVLETPANFTPHVAVDPSSAVKPKAYAIEQIGSTVFVGGRFRFAENAQRTVTYERHNLMAFDATTGQMRDFAPDLNGDVWALEASADALYVGGKFTSVNGVTRAAIAKLDPITGELDPNFQPTIKGARVSEIRLVNGRLLIGGSFTNKLSALNPETGKNTGYIDAAITGSLPKSTDKIEVFKFAVNPSGTRLVGVGNFTTVDGRNRQRAFMLNLELDGDTLSDWYYTPLDKQCRTSSGNRIAYLQDVDFAPDGSYFVFASTGFVPMTTAEIGTALCDMAARFETDILAPQKPTWINYTGGDTLHSVEATGTAIYVSGHSRWLDNPYGVDSAGPGAVVRTGGGAIDPITGKALAWDPVQYHQEGGYGFLSTEAGLWHANDGTRFAGKYHRGIVFTPLP